MYGRLSHPPSFWTHCRGMDSLNLEKGRAKGLSLKPILLRIVMQTGQYSVGKGKSLAAFHIVTNDTGSSRPAR